MDDTSEPAEHESFVVLDTNLFLHFISLERWPWRDIVKLPARLVMCAQVLRELDAQKDRTDSSPKKNRARAAQKLAEQAFERPLPLAEGVTLEVRPLDPPASAFGTQLTREVADDVIIAAAVQLREDGAESVTLVSADTAPRLKARALGLSAIAPPPDLALPTKDPLAAELERARARTRTLEQLQPKPALSFSDGQKSLEVKTPDARFLGPVPTPPEDMYAHLVPMEVPARPSPAEIEAQIAKATAALGPNDNGLLRLLAARAPFLDPDPESVEHYNMRIREFPEEYEEALAEWHAYHSRLSEILVFNLHLVISGTAPAERPEVRMSIAPKHQGRFILVGPGGMPPAPYIPAPPQPPSGNRFRPLFASYEEPEPEGPKPLLAGDGGGELTAFLGGPRFVDYQDSSAVTFGRSDRVRHGSSLHYGPFAIRRVEPVDRGCSLTYEIHADNLATPVVGELHLRFAEPKP